MNKELKEKIAVNAANEWCRCFKCDGRVNATGYACEKDKRLTCHKWYDGYRTALLALEDDRVLDSLWKPADGDDLPEIDREVVVFTQDFPNDAGIMSVAIAHRPNPDGWDGKSLSTGKVEHYTPKTYDKGGWNIPNVKYWLDCLMPNMEED
jgi:hypothetical protein